MKPFPTALLTTGLALAAGTGGTAQCRESSGPFAGGAFAASIEGASFDSKQLYFKPTGFHTTPPAARTGTFRVGRWDLARILQKASGCNIDAMSIGEDYSLVDPLTGKLRFNIGPVGQWGAITVSVTRKTTGEPGSVIHDEAMAGDVAADLFTYVFPGSGDIATNLVGRTVRTHDGGEFGMTAGDDVDSLEYYVPLHDLGPEVRKWMRPQGKLFFSVSKASVTNNCVPAAWWGTYTGPKSGADVFVMTWDAALLKWTPPTLWRTARQLGVDPSEDIDALAVDLNRGVVVFSTDVRIRWRDPLLVTSCGTCQSLAAIPYLDQNGTPISSLLGLCPPGDDVDAICLKDPTVTPNFNPIAFFAGTPINRAFNGWPFAAETLTATAFRGYDASVKPAQDRCDTFLIGGPQSGLVFLAVSIPNAQRHPDTNTLFVIASAPRTWGGPFCGSPTSYSIPLPTLTANWGNEFFIHWFVGSTSGPLTVWEANPLRFQL